MAVQNEYEKTTSKQLAGIISVRVNMVRLSIGPLDQSAGCILFTASAKLISTPLVAEQDVYLRRIYVCREGDLYGAGSDSISTLGTIAMIYDGNYRLLLAVVYSARINRATTSRDRRHFYNRF